MSTPTPFPVTSPASWVLSIILAWSGTGWAAEAPASDAVPMATEQEMLATLPGLQQALAQRETTKAAFAAALTGFQQLSEQHPRLLVVGEVQRQEAARLVVYGTAVGNLKPGQLGLVTKKAFLIIQNPDQHKVVGGVGGQFFDELCYLGADSLGRPIYGALPPTLAKAQADVDAARTAAEQAEAAVQQHHSRALALVAAMRAEVSAREAFLTAGLPATPSSLPNRAAVVAHLDALDRALADWRTAITTQDQQAAAAATPGRERLITAWSTAFTDARDGFATVAAQQQSYREKRDAALAADLKPALAYVRDAIDALPVQTATPEELAQLGLGVRTAWAGAPVAFQNDRLKGILDAWWSTARDSFGQHPRWSTADEAEVIALLASLAAHDPEGVQAGTYAPLITQIEDGLGQRELAGLKQPLATVNPWTETRRLGLTGEDRRYHRALLLQYSAAPSGTQALDWIGSLSAEAAAHPARWTRQDLTDAYLDLGMKQLRVWSGRVRRLTGAALLAEVPTIDRVASISDDVMATLLPNDQVLALLAAIDTAQNTASAPSLLRKDVIARLSEAGLKPRQTWYHGRLLAGADRKATIAEIVALDDVAQAEAAKVPEAWPENAKRLWTHLVAALVSAQGSAPAGADQLSLFQRATNAWSQYDFRNEDRFLEYRERWRKACRAISRADATAMQLFAQRPHLRRTTIELMGYHPDADIGILTAQFWTDVLRDCGDGAADAPASQQPGSTTTPPATPAATTTDPLFGN